MLKNLGISHVANIMFSLGYLIKKSGKINIS